MLFLLFGINKAPIIDKFIRQGHLFFDLDTAPSVKAAFELINSILKIQHHHDIVVTTEKPHIVKKLSLLVQKGEVEVLVLNPVTFKVEPLETMIFDVDFIDVGVQLYKEEIDLA